MYSTTEIKHMLTQVTSLKDQTLHSSRSNVGLMQPYSLMD